jgi:DNA-binding response OmpR family regulator
VLFLSAHDAEMTKLVSFDVGGDDYVTKPASLLELEARVEAILRRAIPRQGQQDLVAEPEAALFSWGGVEMDFANHRATVDGTQVRLSAKETELLHVLVKSHGQVVSRRELLAKVWNYAEDVPSRTLDTHIRSLRRKLASRRFPRPFIETVHGVGYRFTG